MSLRIFHNCVKHIDSDGFVHGTVSKVFIVDENGAIVNEVAWNIIEWLQEIGWIKEVSNTSFKYDYEFVAFYNNWKDNH